MTHALDPAATLRGARFSKMTGSGNDFVVFDGREVDMAAVTRPEVIRAICDRHNGIGADGVVLLEPGGDDQRSTAIRLRYFNRDGSLGELCGNATLCSTALAVRRQLADRSAVMLQTDAGLVHARLVNDQPQIDLAPVTDVRADVKSEVPGVRTASHAGFALVGVPHIVLVLADVEALEQVDVVAQGPPIRQADALQPAGANVNWIAPLGDGRWTYRTYERGVEAETLACGTGAIAAAILLTTWGLAESPVTLVTRSGRPVSVALMRSLRDDAPAEPSWHPSLSGEGRVVFEGSLESLGPPS